MSRNRIRSKNSIPFRHIGKLLGAACLITFFALLFVYLRVRIIDAADEVRLLEVQLQEILEKNNGLQVNIEQMKSPANLQRAVRYFRLNMVDIYTAGLDVREGPAPARSMPSAGHLAARPKEEP